jgi:RimJ/RimL family protein N-acetyltransferase
MARSILAPVVELLGALGDRVFPSFPVSKANGASVAIRLAAHGDAEAFARYLVEHLAESGREGSPHFAPSRTLSRGDIRAAAESRWSRRLDEALWGRSFLLSIDERLAGHLELRGGRIPAEMHRATLGMGVLRSHTGQGHGRRLIEAAVAWARDEAGLSWIELGVFSTNPRARALYRRMGFAEQGLRPDAFRIDAGVAVDDVLMTLDLRRR